MFKENHSPPFFVKKKKEILKNDVNTQKKNCMTVKLEKLLVNKQTALENIVYSYK